MTSGRDPNGGLCATFASVVLLTSKSGRAYLGCDIPSDTVAPYLRQFETEEPADFELLRENQARRDRGHFHVTVISPPEFERVGGNLPAGMIGESVPLLLAGLGKAVADHHRSYFVVVQSERIADLRRSLGLDHRDLHITLGFDLDDVHNISKDNSTLL